MKNKLKLLLSKLNKEQLNSNLLELDYSKEFEQILDTESITLFSKTKVKNIQLANMGEIEDVDSKINLVYLRKDGKLIIKPKLILEFLEKE